MRTVPAICLALLLAGCNRGSQNKDAVRQGVMDHLKARQFNMASMDVNIASVEFKDGKAEAKVSFTAKGAGGQGMSMSYQLEQQGGKWVVVGRDSSGHGGMVPEGDNPHGGMPAPEASPQGGKMPAPESLPPATPKK